MNSHGHAGSCETKSVAAAELARFRRIERLRDHWARADRGRAFYWYLTFESCTELHLLAERCRRDIPLTYYDFTPPIELHMTLDRIAYVEEISPDLPYTIATNAAEACRDISPLNINIGALGGTPGALGLNAFPVAPLRHIRDTLREATLSTYPSAPLKEQEFRPHVAIAYCNSDTSAAQAIAVVEQIGDLGAVAVEVKDVALVMLERKVRAYSWQAITRIPLAGAISSTPSVPPCTTPDRS